MLPSEYFQRQGYATFQDDPIGLETRKWIGSVKILCGVTIIRITREPGPRSQEVIDRTMSDLTEDERRGVLGLNAAKLYGFEIPS